jgi:hypothetical protein
MVTTVCACINETIVQIVFREDFGTDGRGGYFDQYGYVGNNNSSKEVLMLPAFVSSTYALSWNSGVKYRFYILKI